MPRQSKPPINQAKFQEVRNRVLQAACALEAHDTTLAVKYGPGRQSHWYSAGERTRLERLRAAYDRQCSRMFRLLEKSPRRWDTGVPSWWVAQCLEYADAILPVNVPLARTPPLAYGATEPLR